MAKHTVLIVDDSPVTRALFARILADEYDVLQANDGVEALALLREKPADVSVMLLDLMMPIKDGFQVLEEKAFDPSIAHIPTIAISADNETDTELRALNAGAVDFLTKPLEPVIVRRRVKLAIDQRELEMLYIQNRIYEERQYAADHDLLTGIFSKAAFCRETKDSLAQPHERPLLLLRFDIEKFKLINGVFGREMGDHVLRVAADMLKGRVEGIALYGRYESDNFVACFEEGVLDPEKLIEDIGNDMRLLLEDAGLTQQLVLAAGVYPITEMDITVEEMCDRAAMAQRTIKGDYTRHVAYYDDKLREQLIEEQDILDNMENALETGEFEVYLQPVYSMATEDVASAEALVRWNRPGKGIVSPGVFIPLFERNGFISTLDHYIWEQVCSIQAQRKVQGFEQLPISVNLSRKSLYNPNLFEEVLALTMHYGVEPHLFRIEVTESAYMDNAEQLIETVSALRENGFPVLMDDFGSGYSSLNTLKEIPVDMLKMDMRFMEGFEAGGRIGTIMTSVLRMAKWLGVPVIAEGVETAEQYDYLRSVGCEYVQGYYLAKPMPYTAFEEHLLAGQGVAQQIYGEEFSAEIVDDLLGGDTTTFQLFARMFDGMAVYEFMGDSIEVQRAGPGYFDLFGYDADSFRSAGNLLVDRINPEDYKHIIEACQQAVKTGKVARTTITHPSSGRKLLVSCMKFVKESDSRYMLVIGYAFE